MRITTPFRRCVISTLRISTASIAVCSAWITLPAMAQESQVTSSDETYGDIVVKATKRANDVALQDVPAAISAFDEAAVSRANAVDLSDIGRQVPGANLAPSATFSSVPNFFIRGIGVSGTTRSLDPAVGIIVDGVYLGYPVGALADAFDRESIEILRGPQGTLQGRNVTGGAVVVRSARPSGEFRFKGELIAGSFNRIDGSVSVEGPIVPDVLNAKLAVMSRNRDGYWKDDNGGSVSLTKLPTGVPASATGTKPDVETLTIRPMLQFKPADGFEILLIGEYYQDKGGSANSRFIVNTNVARRPTTLYSYVGPADPYEINHDLIGYADVKLYSLTGEVNIDLGGGRLTSVTGYRDLKYNSSTDFDGTPFPIFHFPDNKEWQHQFSQELRYAGNIGDNVSFVIGGNYFDQKYFVGERRLTASGATIATTTLLDRAQVSLINHDSISLFGEADFTVSDAFTITAGGRWTKERKDVTFSLLGSCTLNFQTCTGANANLFRKGSWSDFTPKVALSYDLAPDVHAFASWTRGFRSGTFDARAQTVDSFLNSSPRPERVDSYEAGFKSFFADRKVKLNVALYYAKYKDIQKLALEEVPLTVNPTGRIQRLINAAGATIKGVEIELGIKPSSRVTIDGAFGYTDAKYDQFLGFDANGGGYDPVTDPIAAKKLKFERVPELNASASITYDLPLANGASLAFRASGTFTSAYFNDALNSRIIRQGDYGMLDASITYTPENERWSLSLFGRNLTKTNYFDFALDNAITTVTWGGAPRTWGVKVNVKLD